jgi:ubiquinone/menaquinone biosynthesis C-methylase UbiE
MPPSSHASSWAPDEQGLVYELGRPDYPAEAGELLRQRLDLGEGRTVVDLAAGTGKLTRRLVPTGATVVAVEPMPGMRAQLRLQVPAAPVLAGVAEHLPFRTASLDAVTVAQAFHWFEADRALPELHRVLRPGGCLAVVSNRPDPDDPVQRRIGAILERYEALNPRPEQHRTGRWRQRLEASALFGPIEAVEMTNAQRFADLEALDARFLSISYVILLSDEQRRALVGELHDAVAQLSELVLPLRTRVVFAPRRAAEAQAEAHG